MCLGTPVREPTRKCRVLREPPRGGSVLPEECCPVFCCRNCGLGPERKCWFCRYANFHLKARVAAEVGICCWPEVQID